MFRYGRPWAPPGMVGRRSIAGTLRARRRPGPAFGEDAELAQAGWIGSSQHGQQGAALVLDDQPAIEAKLYLDPAPGEAPSPGRRQLEDRPGMAHCVVIADEAMPAKGAHSAQVGQLAVPVSLRNDSAYNRLHE
jgi:hypothetical protein